MEKEVYMTLLPQKVFLISRAMNTNYCLITNYDNFQDRF